MSDRIDHAARARAVLKSVGEVFMDSDEATVSVIAAQTHATLALVEQQRIANLVALAESGRVTTRGAHAALSVLYDGRVEDGSARMSLSPDIAAALGIEVAS